MKIKTNFCQKTNKTSRQLSSINPFSCSHMAMQSFFIKQYLGYALAIIRSTRSVLWYLVLIGLSSALIVLLKESAIFWPLNSAITVLSIVATPVIYGIYFELIEDTYSSIGSIIKRYLLNYLWLLFRMYVPVVFLAGLPMLLSSGSGSGYFETIIVCFSLLYMYVIPTYYHSGQQRGAISAGISFLLKNLSSSTPLILAVLLLETAVLVLQHNKSLLLESGGLVYIGLDFAFFMVASIIDFALFIVLVYILKDTAIPAQD